MDFCFLLKKDKLIFLYLYFLYSACLTQTRHQDNVPTD
jgi:hypothetical protein